MNPETKPRIFTVGHGDARFQEIERILQFHGIATVVDVRSTPYSKYAPDFRKSTLAEAAAAAGLGYRWMGDRLGGRPSRSAPANREEVGSTQVVVDSPSFRSALAEVATLNTTGPVALMCAERRPDNCHRCLILAPHLEALGIDVFHILPDGTARRHQPSLGI
jgi:uncharacterized protein (DUF488 family)